MTVWHVQVQTGASLQNSPMPEAAHGADLADSPAAKQPMEHAQQVSPLFCPPAIHFRRNDAAYDLVLAFDTLQ